MLILLLVLMSATMAVWVLSPMFAPHRPEGSVGDDPERYLARERAYDSIRDLDFDFHSGKLSEADYHELRERLEREAVAAMRNLEESLPVRPDSDREQP